jgi:RNA polymerase sigma-70 factor (ECF subfamily)
LNRLLPSDEQDLRWLHQAAGGERAAFGALYRRHHTRLSRFLGRMSHRRDLVEEVINDTMWIVWRKAGEFRGDSKVSTWITGIAYRCMLKALRDRVSREPAESWEEHLEQHHDSAEAEAAALAPLPEAETLELRQWLHQGMRRLSEDQRVTLELVYVLGETCEDVATIMGCATGTVKARLFHARMRLRHLLPELGEPRPRRVAAGGAAPAPEADSSQEP